MGLGVPDWEGSLWTRSQLHKAALEITIIEKPQRPERRLRSYKRLELGEPGCEVAASLLCSFVFKRSWQTCPATFVQFGRGSLSFPLGRFSPPPDGSEDTKASYSGERKSKSHPRLSAMAAVFSIMRPSSPADQNRDKSERQKH